MNVNPKIRPLPLVEGGFEASKTTLIQSEKFPLMFQIQDINGSPVDVTTGTVTTLIYNKNTGASVSIGAATTTKSLASSGIITFDGFTWGTVGTFNLYISFVSGGNTRIFGFLRVEVEAP